MLVLAYSYIRFSSRKQRKGDGLRRQVEKSEDWSKRNNIPLDSTVTLHDLGVSALHGIHHHKDNADKYALAAFLQMVKEGRIKKGSYLIIENLDRLSRQDTRAAVSLFLQILELGINIVTTTPEYVYKHDSTDMQDLIIAVVELSRGHSESVVKQSRVSSAWKKRQANARDKGIPLTKQCPAWLVVKEDKYEVIKENAELVKRIYQMCKDGIGIGLIAQTLNKEQIKPFRNGKIWQKSTIKHILVNRAVFGEYQPHQHVREKDKNGKEVEVRKPVGDVIKNYFPVIISETDYYNVQSSLKSRLVKTGGAKFNKAVNIFTSLVVDSEDNTNWCVDTHSNKQYITNLEGVGKGQKKKAIPYRVFEQLVLKHIREIKPSDLLPNSEATEANKLTSLNEEIVAVKFQIEEMQEEMSKPGAKIKLLLPVLENLDEQHKKLVSEYDSLKRQVASPIADSLSQVHTLVDLLDKSEDKDLLRNRLRNKITQVVKKISVDYTAGIHHLSERKVKITVEFKNSPYQVVILLSYTPAAYKREEKISYTVLDYKPKKIVVKERKK